MPSPLVDTLAAIGTVCGIGSLVWQFVTFRHSGINVQVIPKAAASGRAGQITWPLAAYWRQWIPFMVERGYHNSALAVDVVSTGRLPVDITKVAAVFSDGTSCAVPFPPARLDVGSTLTFLVPLSEIDTAGQALTEIGHLKDRAVRMQVTLGNGKVITVRACVL